MLAELFPRVRAGISFISRGLSKAKNYIMRRPYGEPVQYAPGGPFNEREIRQWGVPELNSQDARVRQNLHARTIENLIHDQPVNRVNWLTKRVLKDGLDLGEKGSSWLAGELSKNQEARKALQDVYTSPGMTALVVKFSKPGLLKKRAYTNSILAIAGSATKKPITAGNIFYSDLRNHQLYSGGKLEKLFEKARKLDAEKAVANQQVSSKEVNPMPQPVPWAYQGQEQGLERVPEGYVSSGTLEQILWRIQKTVKAANRGPITVTNDNSDNSYNAKNAHLAGSSIGNDNTLGRGMRVSGKAGEADLESFPKPLAELRQLQGGKAKGQKSANKAASAFFDHYKIANEQHQAEILTALNNANNFKDFNKRLHNLSGRFLEVKKNGDIKKAEKLFKAFKKVY